jgi:hypothetical protein
MDKILISFIDSATKEQLIALSEAVKDREGIEELIKILSLVTS